MTFDNKDYPVVYFKSDTTGEKAYEEFYVSGEKLIWIVLQPGGD